MSDTPYISGEVEDPKDWSDEYASMVSIMAVNTWPVMMKSVMVRNREELAALDCTVVHSHNILTYSVKVGSNSLLQTSDYFEAKTKYEEIS